MITLSEKLILDCSKGISKVAQILKNGLGSPNVCAVLQHASKQKKIFKSGTGCRQLVGFYYFCVFGENSMLGVGLASIGIYSVCSVTSNPCSVLVLALVLGMLIPPSPNVLL